VRDGGLHGYSIAVCLHIEHEWLRKSESDRSRSILTARVTELEEVLRCRELLAVERNPDHLDEVERASDRALVISSLDRESREKS